MNIVRDNTTGVDDDIDDLMDKLSDWKIVNETMSETDIQLLTKRLNSVSSSIGTGTGGGAEEYTTVLGKLNSIETALSNMGADGNTARAFNKNARQKAGNITEFIRLITSELEDDGAVENLEEKMEILEGYLLELKDAVSEIPAAVTSDSVTDSVKQTLDELSELAAGNEALGELLLLVEQGVIKTPSDVESFDFDREGAEMGGLTAEEMLGMRNDVNALKSLMLEIRGLLDSEVNKPIVHGWLEGI